MLFHHCYFRGLDHGSALFLIVRTNWHYWVLFVSVVSLLWVLGTQLRLVRQKEFRKQRIQSMQASEASLMEYALRFDITAKRCSADHESNTTNYDCQIFDTQIEKSCVFSSIGISSSCTQCQLGPRPPHTAATSRPQQQDDDDDSCFLMHGVKVQKLSSAQYTNNNTVSTSTSASPLVFIHGYAGGAFYFYRNFIGLASHFPAVYSIDLLGWGLSSRPPFGATTTDHLHSVESVESFFVESLERWRQKNFTDNPPPKIIIAAHSIGAYLSVAYCEKYSQYVQHLLLISPVGVPSQPSTANTPLSQKTTTSTIPTQNNHHTPLFLKSSYRTQMVKFLWKANITPGMILRWIPERQGRRLISNYIQRRFVAIQCEQEKGTLGNYLYTNLTLPGSGEHSLNRLLKPIAIARKPTVTRIPQLPISHITFIYGQYDWMDINGGLQVQQLCEDVDHHRTTDTTATAAAGTAKNSPPQVDVLLVHNSGHLPMLENWEEFNYAILTAIYGEDYVHQLCQVSSDCYDTTEKNGVTTATTIHRPVSLHFSQFREHVVSHK